MTFKVLAFALAAIGCHATENDFTAIVPDEAVQPPAVSSRPASLVLRGAGESEPVAAELGQRRNVEGELFDLLVPLAAPPAPVELGAECGFITTEGSPVRCPPSSTCWRALPGAPATCVEAPRAPRLDG